MIYYSIKLLLLCMTRSSFLEVQGWEEKAWQKATLQRSTAVSEQYDQHEGLRLRTTAVSLQPDVILEWAGRIFDSFSKNFITFWCFFPCSFVFRSKFKVSGLEFGVFSLWVSSFFTIFCLKWFEMSNILFVRNFFSVCLFLRCIGDFFKGPMWAFKGIYWYEME